MYQMAHIYKLITIKQLERTINSYPQQIISISFYIPHNGMFQSFLHTEGFTVGIAILDLRRCKVHQAEMEKYAQIPFYHQI